MGINEAGYLDDPRCKDALDLLESKMLPAGGFAAEVKYFVTNLKAASCRVANQLGICKP